LANSKKERKGTPLKQKRVGVLSEKIKKAEMAVIADYRGMKMAELSDLRIQLRKKDTEFHIVKNTLVRIASAAVGVAALGQDLSGTTAIAFCFGDVAASAKALSDFARVSKALKIRGALLQGRMIAPQQLAMVADLPPKPVLQAQLLGALQGPSAGLIGILSNPLQSLVAVLQARAQQLGAS
jgi:large subunit ribosomal protein L10